jgi:formate hydrogenlyase transcriptional activator
LREREGDIPLLVRHFTQQFSRRMNRLIETIPSAAMDALCRNHWPGNIRELQNVIERAVIISTGPVLSVDVADLKFSEANRVMEKTTSPKSSANGALHDVLEQAERGQILKALEQCNWIVAGQSGAAARLGMKRSTRNRAPLCVTEPHCTSVQLRNPHFLVCQKTGTLPQIRQCHAGSMT